VTSSILTLKFLQTKDINTVTQRETILLWAVNEMLSLQYTYVPILAQIENMHLSLYLFKVTLNMHQRLECRIN